MSINSGPSDGKSKEANAAAIPEVARAWEGGSLTYPLAHESELAETQELLALTLSGPLPLDVEQKLLAQLGEISATAIDSETQILLSCVSGIGTLRSDTEVKILKMLMTVAPELAALAISVRVNFEPHPDFTTARYVAINYLSYLPVHLAKENLRMAFGSSMDAHSLCKNAFDETKALEFGLDLEKMRASLSEGGCPIRLDRDDSAEVISIIKGINAIVDGNTSTSELETQMSTFALIGNQNLQCAAHALLLQSGVESVVVQAQKRLVELNSTLLDLIKPDL